MNRKFLEDLGLEKEAIDKIMDENGKDIEAAKSKADQSDKIAELETERDNFKSQIAERDKQLNALKKNAGSIEDLNAKIEELQEQNKEAKKAHDQELRQVKINAAVEKALTDSKAKNSKAVKALLDLDDAKLAEDGSVIGLNEQLEALKTGEDSSFLFDDGKQVFKGAFTGDPSDKSGSNGLTLEDFSKMGYQDREKLFQNDRATWDALAAAESGEDVASGGTE